MAIDERLSGIIQCLDQTENIPEKLAELAALAAGQDITDHLIGTIDKQAANKTELLNLIAIHFYQNRLFDSVIPLLETALKLRPADANSLYNLGYILHKLGENELALTYLKKVTAHDEAVAGLIAEIEKTNDRPVISICIATYNRAKRLEKCLESIYSQIGNDNRFEVVVSDNASADNTGEIVAAYRQRYSTLRYCRNPENIGAEKNFLNAMHNSSGSYVFLHGDDDYFVPGSLSMILNAIQQQTGCSVIFLNVVDNSLTFEILTTMEQFFLRASIYATACSSVIFRRQELFALPDLEAKVGTFLPHIYWIYSVLEKNPKSLVLNASIYSHENDNAPGGYIYSFGEVMIKNYYSILAEFVGRGLNEKLIKDEKAKLVNRCLWYFEFGLKRKDSKFVKDFEENFAECYRDEEYFAETCEVIRKIKKENNCDDTLGS